MASLEELRPGLHVSGIVPDEHVAIVEVQWRGSDVVEVIYRRADGQPGTQLIFRDDETSLELVLSHSEIDG